VELRATKAVGLPGRNESPAIARDGHNPNIVALYAACRCRATQRQIGCQQILRVRPVARQLSALAAHAGVRLRYVSYVLPLRFLAPRVVEADRQRPATLGSPRKGCQAPVLPSTGPPRNACSASGEQARLVLGSSRFERFWRSPANRPHRQLLVHAAHRRESFLLREPRSTRLAHDDERRRGSHLFSYGPNRFIVDGLELFHGHRRRVNADCEKYKDH
jgi:hypothetical protein